MRSGRRGVVSRGRVAVMSAAGGVASAMLCSLGGCQLVLDFAPLPDGAPSDAPMDGACEVAEPNESAAAAAPLPADPVSGAICGAGDRDFYGFSVNEGDDVVVGLTFDAELGDLELELWAIDSDVALEISTGTDDDEQIERSAALDNALPAGDYAVGVLGRDEAVENTYELTVTITPADPAADPDPDAGV